MTQLEIDLPVHGKSYDAKRDKKRIQSMRQRIWDLMSDGKWRTITDIKMNILVLQLKHVPDCCDISRRLREMREIGFKVEAKRHNARGVWVYRAVKK